MLISSQGPMKGQGSETIPQGSRVQADSKRPAPDNWGDEIVQSSWKREAALKTLVKNLRISDKGCWEWQGSKTLGYGSVRIPEIYGQFKIMVHRLAWVAFKGVPIVDGLFVCHKCDNPKCFNPDHLFVGTQQQNLQDCSAKERTMTGDRNGNSKYTKEQINNAQQLLKSGLSGKEVASQTGISRTHVSRIKRGYTWKHETASDADLVHRNRKYYDEQLIKVAELLLDGKLPHKEIAEISGVNYCTVKDMHRGRIHQRFIERATK